MPKDKTQSHIRVNAAIKAEFLENGYERSSVRSIGERAGMTSAGLYRHYKDKEDMFNSMMEPLIESIRRWTDDHKKMKYSMLDSGTDMKILFGQTFIDMIIDEVYPKKDEFRILLCCSQGTKYENFMHDYITEQENELIEAIDHMANCGYPVRKMKREDIHMILSAYVTAIFEPIKHNYSKDELVRCLGTINDFFMPGWKRIMGIKEDS